MKVTAFLRIKSVAKNNVTDLATIYFRVRDEGVDLKAASELSINPNHWSQERQGYKNRVALIRDEERYRLNDAVRELSSLIAREYYIGADSKWLQRVIFVYRMNHIFYILCPAYMEKIQRKPCEIQLLVLYRKSNYLLQLELLLL